ncbi:hypothetical protein [Campylobacter majalis]|nr:hypothetical protein [Campylobacter majalis]
MLCYPYSRTLSLCKMCYERLFDEISMPKHNCFFADFEQWQSKNNYPKGEIFYKYPPKLGLMNKILATKIPKVSLHKPYENDKKLYKDSEKFAKDLSFEAMK